MSSVTGDFESYDENGNLIFDFDMNTPRIVGLYASPASYNETNETEDIITYLHTIYQIPADLNIFWFDGGLECYSNSVDYNDPADLFWPEIKIETHEYYGCVVLNFNYPIELKDEYFTETHNSNRSKYKVTSNLIWGVY